MNFIKRFFQNATTQAKILVIGGVTVFVTIIIISIINLLPKYYYNPADNIDVVNYSSSLEQYGLPSNLLDILRRQVWDYIKDNEKASQLSTIPITIREETVRKNENHEYTFVIDIEPLRYSFHVTYSWNPEYAGKPYYTPAPLLECPYPDEIIYPDTPCPIGTPIDQIERYLPTKLSYDGVSINAKITDSMIGRYIIVEVDTCDEKIQDEGDIFFRNWVKQLYLDPNNYDIRPRRTCYN